MSIIDRASSLVAVCPVERLTTNRGVAALLEGRAVAIFLLRGGEIRAIDNVDPVTGASVLSRGLVGDADGVPFVASPLHKQRYHLRSGHCLDVEDLKVAAHEVQVVDGTLHIALSP